MVFVNKTDLIQRARQGEERALDALYADCAPDLYRLAYGLLGNREDAEEVVQDALTYAFDHLARYDPQRASLRTWLHTITVSRCRNKRRRRWLPTIQLSQWLGRGQDLPDPPNHRPEAAVLAEEKAREVWQAVEKLSPKVREVVVLRYWGDHTVPEIARIVGCPTSTAQSRLRLAHEQMERHLQTTRSYLNAVEEIG